ncbi:hypothetical protein L9F63_023943, partial [Diploptera punctata]
FIMRPSLNLDAVDALWSQTDAHKCTENERWLMGTNSIEGGVHSNVDTAHLRIVNGTKAPAGKFPYMISLQYDGSHECGGTILSEKWILTAAHCVYEEVAVAFSVLAGTVNLSTGGVRRSVKRYIIYEQYDPEDNYKNDIALLELESALPLSQANNIQAVKLPQQDATTAANKTATVMGWGHIYTGGPTSEVLLMVDLKTYSDEDCVRLLAGNSHPTNICAGVEGGGKGFCGGDSGGPLIVDGVQVGIVSWSVKPCASPPYPGIYTRVSSYTNWIENRTGLSF